MIYFPFRPPRAFRGRPARAGAVLCIVLLGAVAGTLPFYLRPGPAAQPFSEVATVIPSPPATAPVPGAVPTPAAPAPEPTTGAVPPTLLPEAPPPAAPAQRAVLVTPPPATPSVPAWRRLAVPAAAAEGRPTITIMIDDMGLNRVQSDRAVRMPAPLTLSWMPYAANVTEQAAFGAARGHETMLHMNMEALGRTYPGPDSLRTWLPPDTNLAYLRHALDRLPLAVGLNQHEGSVASLSVPLMDLVMGELKARGLLFVDSLTISHSVAMRRAELNGVAAGSRDVFLDNSPDPSAIRAQLAAMEAMARRVGHVIAIGHPRQTTMDVLAAYLPTLAMRGFVLWPISATVAASNSVQFAQRRAAE